MEIKSLKFMKEVLQLHAEEFKKILKNEIEGINTYNSGEEELKSAILYSLIEGNPKFIRSFIVYEVAKMLSNDVIENVKNLAMAVEMIHAYSLIHDDLPAMDNSNLRRGVEATHIKFSQSTAILAGNSLQVMAFEVLAKIGNYRIIQDFCSTVGLRGIMSGQVLDLSPKFKQFEFEEMNYKKTGVLIEFCLTAPAILLGREEELQSLKIYGKHLGLAYQMQDDLLDEGEQGYSYINYFNGVEELKNNLKDTVKICKEIMSKFPKNNILLNLPEFLAKRVY
jgi:geranylgeranyl pyrophosphate synthase